MSAASSPASPEPLPPLLDEDYYTFVNKRAVDRLIPASFRTVLRWGCQKPPDTTYLEYLQQKTPSDQWQKYKKRWTTADFHKLQKKDCGTFDVTYLFKLIPEVCDGIAKCGSGTWSGSSTDTVESLLSRAKNIRNDVMHQPEDAAVSPTVLPNVEDTLIKLLEQAGSMYGAAKTDVDREINNIQTSINEIRLTLMNDKQKVFAQIRRKMKTDGKREIKDLWEQLYQKELLPFSRVKVNRSDVFHFVKLQIKKDQGKLFDTISCENLFQVFPGFQTSVQHIVIEGVAGSGKTTLLKHINQDFLNIEKNELFKGVRNFPLTLYIECRNSVIDSLNSLVSLTFPRTTRQLEISDVVNAILDLGPLVLIDGIDEWNRKSRKLVEEVLECLKGNAHAKFVYTSRPNMSHEVTQLLERKQLDYCTVKINEIEKSEEQIQFLETYQNVIPEIQAPGLVNSFKYLRKFCDYLVYPVYLTLFCHLYIEYPEDVKTWNNEKIILEKTLELCRRKILDRMENVKNKSIIVEEIINAVCDLSLRCVHQNYISVSKENFQTFCIECFRKYPELDYDSILSCILSLKSSLYGLSKDTYEFFHRSQQEYLASRAVSRRLKPGTSALDVLSKEVGERIPVNEAHLNRYVNVLKFVIFEFQGSVGPPPSSHLLQLLAAAGADFATWAEVVPLFPGNRQVARIAATACRSRGWEVRTPRHMTAATNMLPHGQPPSLLVQPSRHDGAPGEDLALLVAAAATHHRGLLALRLQHSHDTFTPADEVLQHLSTARCRVWLTACVSGAVACRAVSAVLERGALHRISLVFSQQHPLQHPLQHSLQHPLQHPLLLLHPRQHNLCVTVLHPVTPLPPAPHAWPLPCCSLVVQSSPSEGEEDLRQLLVCLAPPHRSYLALQLRCCSLSDAALHRLLHALHRAGVRTATRGGVWWKPVRMYGGSCCGCFQSGHGGESRCVNLVLEDSSDGNTDGTVDGNTDGTSDGNTDGTGGGNTDGTGDGNTDGTGDGNTDGTGDSNTDGTVGGNTDCTGGGNTDGTGKGNTDGTGDGNTDGTSKGNTDGTGDGNTDGTGGGNTDGTGDGNTGGPGDSNTDGTGDGNTDVTSDGNTDGTGGGNTDGISDSNSSDSDDGDGNTRDGSTTYNG